MCLSFLIINQKGTNMKKLSLLFLCFYIISTALDVKAQIVTPQASPKGSITQKVGLTDFTIIYSRPSVKGRIIFGDLVPYGQTWRTGANESTKISFSEDIIVEGQTIKAGEYAIYTVPNKDTWDFIFYKNTTHWGNPDVWKEDEVALRVKLKPTTIAKVESLTFDFANITNNGADIILSWDIVSVSLKISVNTEAKVMKSIESTLAGPSANDYYSAGRFYLESGKDANQAYLWLHKANEMSPKFFMLRQEALALAKLSRYKDAITVANKSIEMAKEAKNEEYVKMNTKDIEKWSKMK